ncbi:MAG: collagenase [Gammaproteobacteria bacterium]|nr:collagenase [Gammaproteobacteria bacterium]
MGADELESPELRLSDLTIQRIAAIDARLHILVPPDARRTPSEPLPQLLDPADRLGFDLAKGIVRKSDHCDDDAFATKSGDALVAHIRSAPYECVSRLFTDAPGSVRFAALRARNMIDVARAAKPLADAYGGTNLTNLREIFLFLRAGYFVAFYEGDDLDWAGQREEIDAAIVAALNAFVDNAHFYAATDAHADVLGEAMACMDSSEQQARYLPQVKGWLKRWKPEHVALSGLSSAVNGAFTVLFRGHQQQAFVDAVATDTELVGVLRDFALQEWMLDTSAEFMAANAGRELVRFTQYRDAPIHSHVQAAVTDILDRYEVQGKGQSIWIATAGAVLDFGGCADFEICGFEVELEARILDTEHACSDSVSIRAQTLSAEQLDRACTLLERQESEFHFWLRTGGEPVANDHNTALEVVVFEDDTNYATYSRLFFGNDTNNGGIYLEGDPNDPSNTARFIAYVQTAFEDKPIWNLEHEQVHYLDGRYNLVGSFFDYRVDSHKTVWWLEGLAEYVSLGNANQTAVEVGRAGDRPLSDVFEAIYGDGTTTVYRWSYLAVRFFFERHRDAVDTFLAYFREGDYDGYLEYLDESIGQRYDAEWTEWLADVVATDDGTLQLIELPSALTMDEESSASYEIRLATPPTEDVTIEVRAPDNVTVDKRTLTFTGRNWNAAQTVTVTVGADENTSDETVTLMHTATSAGYAVSAPLAVTVLDSAPTISFANPVVSAREGSTVRLTIGIEEPRPTPTTIGFVHITDDDPATSDADGDDHDGVDGLVRIADGRTEATYEITIHDDAEIEPARERMIVALEPSIFSEFRPGVTRATVIIDEGVCDRTPGVRDELRGSRDCSAVSDVDLAEIWWVNLNDRLDGTLKEDDLSGLTGMGDVRLQNNGLSELPAALFDETLSLSYLHLEDNELASLPRGLFDRNRRLERLYLEHNKLAELPAGLFERLANLTRLQLQGNPGAPFPLALNWLRTDASDPAAPGPATIVATVREGAPFDMEADVSATNGKLSTARVRIPAGGTRSEPVTVESIGAGAARVVFDTVPAIPDTQCDESFPCFDGLATATGKAIVLFGIPRTPVEPPAALRGADVARIELADLFPDAQGEGPTYTAESSDPALASVSVRDGVLTVIAGERDGEGVVTVTVTRTAGDGTMTTRTFSVTIRPRAASEAMVYLFPSTFNAGRQGFVRVINRSTEAGEIDIAAFEDSGRSRPPVSLTIGAGETKHFNSEDLEQGNAGKGLSSGIGAGEGDWLLKVSSDLDIEVLSYMRTADGFLTAMHDVVILKDTRGHVPIFNPGSNRKQRSLLRLINPGVETATVTIAGIDDDGDSPGSDVRISIPAGAARTIGSAELESGSAGFRGALGDGKGKWRLQVTSDRPVTAVNLLESPTGHLTNLSTTPNGGERDHSR